MALPVTVGMELQAVYKALKYPAGFIVGLLEGAKNAVVDLFQGAIDMIETVGKLLYNLITGNLGEIKKMLTDWISTLKVAWKNRAGIASDFMERWEAEDGWNRGRFQGKVLGWVMMTVVIVLLTAGAGAIPQIVGKWKFVIDALKLADRVQDLGTYVRAVGKLPGSATDFVRSKFGPKAGLVAEQVEVAGGKPTKEAAQKGLTKAGAGQTGSFKTLQAAHEWAVRVLRAPASILKDLTLDAVNRLRLLPDEILEKLSRLSVGQKRKALGCGSKCRADAKEAKDYVSGAQAETAGRKESMAYWKGRETLTSFARHKQTFSSLARTLKNKARSLARAGQQHLLPTVDDSVLSVPIDIFIRRHLNAEWAALEAQARRNPDLAQEMQKFLEGKLKAGARNVGARETDIVEFFLDEGEIIVTDITRAVGDPVHTFKTRFYQEVIRVMVGPSGPKVFGLDIDPIPKLHVRATIFD
jgi:hypothetical protein